MRSYDNGNSTGGDFDRGIPLGEEGSWEVLQLTPEACGLLSVPWRTHDGWVLMRVDTEGDGP